MALFVRRSILTGFSITLLCLSLFLTGEALAQHPGARVGGGVAVPPAPMMHPPVYHPPVFQAPIYQPPIYRAPLYAPITAPHAMTPSLHTLSAVPFRLPGPIRPFPLRYVYVVPVFTTPFWPFNNCWRATSNQ